MIRDNNLGEGIVPAEDDVAPFLAAQPETCFLQGLQTIPPGHTRQFAHTATSKVSNLSSGTGK